MTDWNFEHCGKLLSAAAGNLAELATVFKGTPESDTDFKLLWRKVTDAMRPAESAKRLLKAETRKRR